MKIILKNVCVVNDENELSKVSIIIEDGKIMEVSNQTFSVIDDVKIVDGQGALCIPGMLDVHIHGANGFDMMDGTVESIQEVSKTCLETGCTGFLVTTVTSSLEKLIHVIEATKKTIGKEKGAKILGIHLEGPYLSIEKKGMQNPKYLRNPDIVEMKKILDFSNGLIKMVTLAPELPGAIDLIKFLVKENIIVSLGHTNASYDEAQLAFENGATHVTHCFNALPQIHHRSPGVIVAAFENDSVSLQAIVDNVHLHPAIVRLMYRIKGGGKTILITDAMQAMGKGDGKYIFGEHDVTVKEGVATLSDGTLASSTVTMNRALKICTEIGIPLKDAVRMGTLSVAELLKEKQLGKIEKGNDADLVLLTEDFDIALVLLKGRILINQ